MRGVFNDFASEINRSIGFYSSINRTAKIRKVIGLGNGFKLRVPKVPSAELEPRDRTARGVREDGRRRGEVPPQFQDNLASFAVAYGLGVQGLDRANWGRTCCLRRSSAVRLVRAKKPWALAASALVMSASRRCSPSVITGCWPRSSTLISRTPSIRPTASAVKSTHSRPHSRRPRDFQTKVDEGSALIVDPQRSGPLALFLKTMSSYFPDRSGTTSSIRRPGGSGRRSRSCGSTSTRSSPCGGPTSKRSGSMSSTRSTSGSMHPYDVANPPPARVGWVRCVCHHYNPYPTTSRSGGSPRTRSGRIRARTSSSPRRCSRPSTNLHSASSASITSPWRGWCMTARGPAKKEVKTTTWPATLSRYSPELRGWVRAWVVV